MNQYEEEESIYEEYYQLGIEKNSTKLIEDGKRMGENMAKEVGHTLGLMYGYLLRWKALEFGSNSTQCLLLFSSFESLLSIFVGLLPSNPTILMKRDELISIFKRVESLLKKKNTIPSLKLSTTSSSND